MREIDERIVEMRFDNKQFESATKETLGTLARLKEALKLPNLKNALSGIDEAAKKTKLDGIASAVEALERRFSTLGIVGMRVIENLTDAVMNKLIKALNFASDAIVSGGMRRAMNIENAHFQLQALLKDEAKVQAVMADAMESVDGTAYAYDEAAKAASQFAASGVQAGEDMLNALKGITGVAAMTNSSFEDISRVFTTVAGNGRLMGDQLLQLSSRGLNAASTIADYFKEVRGQASMTEAEIREMVTDGELDFKTFSDAMTWAFGDSAKRANETFTGSMSNMKSALARIGAEFVSPFIEQNSEMVKLFNALRIQINNVKSALTFNEQRSAIAGLTKESNLMVETVSQFTKDGTISFDKFTSAILGTSKSEKELAEANENLKASYEKVKESGSASVDTLMEFNSNGVNAVANLQKYINGVLDGSIRVSEEVKKNIEEISGGIKLTTSDILDLAKDGKISFDVFTDSIVNASGAISNESKLASDAFTALMGKVKSSGSVTFEALKEFNKNGVDATKALLEYMNGVQDGSIRASYSTTQAIEEITGGTRLLQYQVNNLAKEGKISYDIFQSAMENMYGTEQALSKQFTDFVLDNIKQLVTYVENINLTKPLEAFYYVVESGKNILKGLYSVIKPIASAFSEVFLDFNGDDIVKLADKLETITSKLRLSEKGSENLRKAFKGVFDVAKLLIDIFVKLIRAIIPLGDPVEDLGGGFLGLAGSAGEALSKFTEWVRSSPRIKNVYDMLSDVIKVFAKHVGNAVGELFDFIKYISQLPVVEKLLRAAENSFNNFLDGIGPFFENFGEKVIWFKDLFVDLIPDGVLKAFGAFSDEVKKMVDEFNNLEVNDLGDVLDFFIKKFKDFIDFFLSNDALNTFVQNIKFFFQDLGDAFSLESISEKIEKTLDILGRMVDFFQNVFGGMFKDFSLGGSIAAGSGIALIAGIFKSLKSFDKFTNVINFIPKTLGAIKDTLVSYQKNLNADAIWKIAKSIAVLAGSLILLSFAEPDRVILAAGGLAIAGYTILKGLKELTAAAKATKPLEKAIASLVDNLGISFKNLSKALKRFSIGSMFKDFAKTIAIVALTIVGLGLMWEKNSNAIIKGGQIVSILVFLISGMMVGLSFLGEYVQRGMLALSKATGGILKMAIALGIIVFAIRSIMSMQLPASSSELLAKMDIFGYAILGLSVLMIALGKASQIAMSMKMDYKSILAATLGLILIVKAFKMLNDIPIGWDWIAKVPIFAAMFFGLREIIEAIGYASKLAGGALKSAPTIIALAGFLIIATAALKILSTGNPLKLIAPTIALGVILYALSKALYGAGQITTKTNWKSILAMAIDIGVIMAALGILSIVPLGDLAKSTGALFLSLVGVAGALYAAGQIADQAAFGAILAMAGVILTIGVALYALSEQPFDGILVSSIALAGTMMVLAGVFNYISKSANINPKQILSFFTVCIAIVPLAIALGVLSVFPVEGVIIAAVGLSSVVLAMSLCFAIISKVKVPFDNVLSFVTATIALLPMAIAIGMIADQPWDGLIAAAVGLSALAIAFSVGLAIVGNSNINIVGCLGFVLASLALLPIAGVIKYLAEVPFEKAISGVVALAAALLLIGVFSTAMSPIATGMILVAVALGIFGVAIGVVGVGLKVFVESLISAMDTFLTFFSMLDPEVFYQVGYNIVMGLIQGILGGLAALTDVLVEVCNNGIVGTVMHLLGIHSPSTIMEAIGQFLDMGFANGVMNGQGYVSGSMMAVFGDLDQYVAPNALFGKGSEAATNFAKGIGEKTLDVKGIVASVVGEAQNSVDTEEFQEVGEESMQQMATGMGNFDMNAYTQQMMDQVMGSINLDGMYDLGGMSAENLFSGFTDAGSGLGNYGNFDFSSMITNAFQNAGDGADYTPLQITGQDGSQQFIQTFQDSTKKQIPEVSYDIATSLAGWLKEKIHAANFTQQGEMLIADFASAFTRSQESIATTIGIFMEYAIEGIKGYNLIFERAGMESAENWTTGVSKRYELSDTTARGLVDRVIEAIKNKFRELKTKGEESGDKIIEGFKSRYDDAYDAADELASQMLMALAFRLKDFRTNGTDSAYQYVAAISEQNINSYTTGYNLSNQALAGIGVLKSSFYDSGANAAQGFVNGLGSKLKSVRDVAAEIGNIASRTLAKALDEHSPSKVTKGIGEYFTEGFVNGIISRISLVDESSEQIGDEAIKAVQKEISRLTEMLNGDEFSGDFTITPRVDTSYVDQSIREISDMFSNAVNQEANLTQNVSGDVRRVASYKSAQYDQNGNDEKYKELLTKMTDLENRPNVENTFYVTGNNPDQIAEKVSVILQKQYTRRAAAWE